LRRDSPRDRNGTTRNSPGRREAGTRNPGAPASPFPPRMELVAKPLGYGEREAREAWRTIGGAPAFPRLPASVSLRPRHHPSPVDAESVIGLRAAGVRGSVPAKKQTRPRRRADPKGNSTKPPGPAADVRPARRCVASASREPRHLTSRYRATFGMSMLRARREPASLGRHAAGRRACPEPG
jgi:hypothetical protein